MKPPIESLTAARWDIALVLAVIAMSTLTAYLYQPKLKALIISLPIPFTLATLSVGRPVGAMNVSALIVLLIFTNLVRWLYCTLRVPITTAITISAALYCLLAAALRPITPNSEPAFWLIAGATFALAVVLCRTMPYRHEPGHRTPLPVWVKVPIITAVVLALIAMKHQLQGYMTMFPMVGVITAYEARRSLWTISRQIPIFMTMAVPMLAACHLVEARWTMAWGLAAGWLVFLAILIPWLVALWSEDAKMQKQLAASTN